MISRCILTSIVYILRKNSYTINNIAYFLSFTNISKPVRKQYYFSKMQLKNIIEKYIQIWTENCSLLSILKELLPSTNLSNMTNRVLKKKKRTRLRLSYTDELIYKKFIHAMWRISIFRNDSMFRHYWNKISRYIVRFALRYVHQIFAPNRFYEIIQDMSNYEWTVPFCFYFLSNSIMPESRWSFMNISSYLESVWKTINQT